MARNTKGYKFDFENKTIVMTKTFHKEACKPDTPENKEMLKLMKKYPDFSIDWKSARTQKKARPDKDFSYEKMEEYIATFNNADELLEIFEKVKVRGRITASPRKYVSDWFKAQFPNYKSAIVTDTKNLIIMPIAIPDTANYKPKTQELPEVAEG